MRKNYYTNKLKRLFYLIAIISCFSEAQIYSSSQKNKVQVSMVHSTAIDKTLPFEALAGKKWRANSKAEYVKFHIYLDKSVKVSSVSMDSCAKSFSSKATLFLNFDEKIVSLKLSNNDKSLSVNLNKPFLSRSLTLNFKRNKEVCIQNLSVFDEKNRKIEFKLPKVERGAIKVSHKTGVSYRPMNLFDSRFEYAWSPVPKDRERSLEFQFKRRVSMTGIKIWNGYQRSAVHCVRNGRVKELTITGDNNFKETVKLKDTMKPQVINFTKTFKGKNLKFTVSAVYRGKKFKDPVVSELRFLNGDDSFIIDPLRYMQDIRKENSKTFVSAKLKTFLDKNMQGFSVQGYADLAWVKANGGLNLRRKPSVKSGKVTLLRNGTKLTILKKKKDVETIGAKEGHWVNVSAGKYKGWVFDSFIRYQESSGDGNQGDSLWTLRLRADGSLYLDGSTSKRDEEMEETKVLYALGNFEIIESGKDEIELKLFGLLRTVTKEYYLEEMDCNGCGRDCNKLGRKKKDGSREEVFVEKVKLKYTDSGYLLINNSKKPILGFRSLLINLKK